MTAVHPKLLKREYALRGGAVPGDPKYDRLRESVERDGMLVPIDVTEDGWILDGHHRHAVALDLGLTRVPIKVRES